MTRGPAPDSIKTCDRSRSITARSVRPGTKPFPPPGPEEPTTMPRQAPPTLALAHRVRELRLERFSEQGGPTLARALGLPHRTWINYEAGVTIPAPVILRLI